MHGPASEIVGLHDSGDQLCWYFRFILTFGFLFWLVGIFLIDFDKLSIVFGHFVPDFALIPSLFNKSALLFVPFEHLSESL